MNYGKNMERQAKNDKQNQETDTSVRDKNPDTYIYHTPEMAEKLARENGLDVHIKKSKGVFLGDPVGYNPNRINFTISDGVVTNVSFG